MPELRYESDGVWLHVMEEGHGSAVIMLHGGGADHHAVWPFVAPLSPRYRVIAPDLRGSGKSHCADSLSWDRLADDLNVLLDHIGSARAVIGGASMGTGVALRFARRSPARVAGLVLMLPVYAGEDRGLTEYQAARLGSLDPILAKVDREGIEAFRPLYRESPAMEAYFDSMIRSVHPPSFVATNRFVASGVQPFASAADLQAIVAPTLLIPGNDPMHPAEISDLYAARIPNCVAARLPETADYGAWSAEVAAAIGSFCGRSAIW
ncbi:MAG: alpha/beta hydrolase [Candidatus Acidiferrales bacterium]